MEASHNGPKRPQSPHVFLSPDVIEIHIQTGNPVSKETAKLVWTMNKLIDEWDSDNGAGVMHEGDW